MKPPRLHGTEQDCGETVNVVAHVKASGQRYVLIYLTGYESGALRQLGKWAANPECDFSWYDAAMLSQRIRKQKKTLGEAK